MMAPSRPAGGRLDGIGVMVTGWWPPARLLLGVRGMALYPSSRGEGAPQPGSGGPVRRTDSRVSTSRYLEKMFSVSLVMDPPSLQNRRRASIQAL